MEHGEPVEGVVVTSNSKYAVSWSSSHISVWELESGKRLGSKMVHEEIVEEVALSRDQSRVVSKTLDRVVHFWDIQSGHEIGPPLTLAQTPNAAGFVLSQDGKRLLSWSAEWLHWWDIDFGSGDSAGHCLLAREPRRYKRSGGAVRRKVYRTSLCLRLHAGSIGMVGDDAIEHSSQRCEQVCAPWHQGPLVKAVTVISEILRDALPD